MLCPVCHLGHLNPVRTVLVRFYGDTLVQVPNSPAAECDVCSEMFFDEGVLRRLDVLIGESGPPPNRHTPAIQPPPVDTDSEPPILPLRPRPK